MAVLLVLHRLRCARNVHAPAPAPAPPRARHIHAPAPAPAYASCSDSPRCAVELARDICRGRLLGNLSARLVRHLSRGRLFGILGTKPVRHMCRGRLLGTLGAQPIRHMSRGRPLRDGQGPVRQSGGTCSRKDVSLLPHRVSPVDGVMRHFPGRSSENPWFAKFANTDPRFSRCPASKAEGLCGPPGRLPHAEKKLAEIGLGEGAGSGISFGEGARIGIALDEGRTPSASRFSASRPSPSPIPAKKTLCKRDLGQRALAKRVCGQRHPRQARSCPSNPRRNGQTGVRRTPPVGRPRTKDRSI